MTRPTTTWLASTGILLLAGAVASADVLVMRDGRRFDGTLVNVRGETLEFEHRGGRDDGRVRRYDRREVRSIEFQEGWYDGDARSGVRGRPGLRERTVTVDARTVWTDTGVDVRAGQDVMFSASGQVRWGPNRRDGADGERNSPANPARPMPQRSAAALIGRIGPDGDPFFIGSSTQPIRVRGSGRLFLGINDDYLQDNSGSFRVVIGY